MMVCSWNSDEDEIVMEVQENPVASMPLQHFIYVHSGSRLPIWNLSKVPTIDLNREITMFLKEAKTTVDTEKSSWKKLLDEFEEEGHSDLHINGHDLHKTTEAETGGGYSQPMQIFEHTK